MPSDEDLQQWAQQYEGMNYTIRVGACGACAPDSEGVVHRRVAVTPTGRVDEASPMLEIGETEVVTATLTVAHRTRGSNISEWQVTNFEWASRSDH